MQYAASKNDVENVEAWAEVVKAMLQAAPPGIRTSILERAANAQKKDDADRSFGRLKAETISLDDPETSEWQNHHAIFRLKSLVAQRFIRAVTSDQSPEDASNMLFGYQPYGAGSKVLKDYIDKLPKPTAIEE